MAFITGTNGNDNLISLASDDQIDGLAGDDILSYNYATDGADLINLGSGMDKVLFTGASNYILRMTFSSADVGNNNSNNVADSLAVSLQMENNIGQLTGHMTRSDDEGIQWVTADNTPFLFKVSDDYFGSQVLAAVSTIVSLGTEQNDTLNSVTIRNVSLNNAYLNGGAGNDYLIAGAETDYLVGGSGNDTLDGGQGGDWMLGGTGNDVYYVDRVTDITREFLNEGVDTIYSTITLNLSDYSDNIEILRLQGNANLNATGNDLANTLVGNAGDNILDGGIGTDKMAGGLGHDTYYVNTLGDSIIERYNAGFDKVYSSIDYSLAANIEYLQLTDLAIRAKGNSLDNVLIGNNENNILNGLVGADTMQGGQGNDIYYVDNNTDIVLEDYNSGSDLVILSVFNSFYSMSANVETLRSDGTGSTYVLANDLNNKITGNIGDNYIFGDIGNDTLLGGAGSDWLDGGAGNDVLYGGIGADAYFFARGGSRDVIWENDIAENVDTLNFEPGFAGAIDADQLWFSQVGQDLKVSVIGTNDSVIIKNWYVSTHHQVEQFQASDGRMLTNLNVQNLVNAMAGMTPPPLGQTEFNAAEHAQYDAVIAANWSVV
ncbi:calcium-binding protein [Agitococcus lubricus]|uniref:Hemolysin type calcium-binding protein n=1 Tax=Agitococcus lubricus TaxID=1077255 RepID=A0A2T5J0M2_9GAMM|nr:calcium-binding protein [Agitococcus lubricus]PTQ89855.1 hemolysin type calcium-binding protein [Agitococcus lubricus]